MMYLYLGLLFLIPTILYDKIITKNFKIDYLYFKNKIVFFTFGILSVLVPLTLHYLNISPFEDFIKLLSEQNFLGVVIVNENLKKLLYHIFSVGLIEEFSKILFFYLGFKLIKRKSGAKELKKNLLYYGMLVGLGFAFIENIFYGVRTIESGKSLFNLFYIRATTSTLLHTMLTPLLLKNLLRGERVIKYKNKLDKLITLIVSNLFLVALIHGIYNTSNTLRDVYCILFMLIIYFLSFKEYK